MRILASQYITTTAKGKKIGQTIHSCSTRVSYTGIWAVIYSVITRVLIARAHVRPEQHMFISVFKLNSCKLCQFKHLRARGCELAHAVRRLVRALIRRAQTCTLECTHILSALWSFVFEWTHSDKNSQNANTWKVSYSRHSRLNVQYQCTGSVHSLEVTALS